MEESGKKWLWLGLGAAAGAGLVWWLAKRGQQVNAAQAIPQLPQEAVQTPAGVATEGMVNGYGEPPPPPAQIVTQAPQSVPDNGQHTEGGDWDQNDEF